MPELTTLKIAELTGLDRQTVRKRLAGVPFRRDGDNEKAWKYYDSTVALFKVCLSRKSESSNADRLSPQDALAVAKKTEIDLNIEIKRKERIPLEDLEEINDEAYSNAAGLLKASLGKELTEEVISDILSQFRETGNKIREKVNGHAE